MHVKNAKKASSKLQKMQTALSKNCCTINAPILSAVIHCLQWMTAKMALKLQWEFEHCGNLQCSGMHEISYLGSISPN